MNLDFVNSLMANTLNFNSVYFFVIFKNLSMIANILKGIFSFQKSVRMSLFGFNIRFDHKRVRVPNIGSLAHS